MTSAAIYDKIELVSSTLILGTRVVFFDSSIISVPTSTISPLTGGGQLTIPTSGNYLIEASFQWRQTSNTARFTRLFAGIYVGSTCKVGLGNQNIGGSNSVTSPAFTSTGWGCWGEYRGLGDQLILLMYIHGYLKVLYIKIVLILQMKLNGSLLVILLIQYQLKMYQ